MTRAEARLKLIEMMDEARGLSETLPRQYQRVAAAVRATAFEEALEVLVAIDEP